MNNTAKYILIAIVILVVGVLGYFGYKYFLFQQVAKELPPEGTVVVFSERGVGKQYRFMDNALVAQFPADQEGVVIYEEVQSPLNAAEKVVLGSSPEIPGMFVGRVREDGKIALLMTGGTNKAELSVNQNGLVVFAAREAMTDIPQHASEDGETEEGPEQTFSAEGEQTPQLQLPNSSNLPNLFGVELDTGAIYSFGAGRNPRFTADGSLIVVAQNGVVRVEPRTGARSLILPYAGMDALYGAVSLSGSMVALPADDYMSIAFYSLENPDAPVQVGILQLERRGPYPIVFVDDEHFFMRTASDVAVLYKSPTEALPTAVPVAYIPIQK